MTPRQLCVQPGGAIMQVSAAELGYRHGDARRSRTVSRLVPVGEFIAVRRRHAGPLSAHSLAGIPVTSSTDLILAVVTPRAEESRHDGTVTEGAA